MNPAYGAAAGTAAEAVQGATPSPAFSILAVDDDENILRSVRTTLQTVGITNILVSSEARRVPQILARHDVGIIILDLVMPDMAGLDLLTELRRERPSLSVVVVTGRTEVEPAVECMKAGAADYLTKPVDRNRLVAVLRRLVENEELRRENESLKEHLLTTSLRNPDAFASIATVSASMLACMRYAEAIAGTSQPVLITGETGVGKDLFAQAIHALSGRGGEFIAVNGAGLDESLFADALFGHRKGAFTGAESPFGGFIERAAGGTLFLDEIGELPTVSQVKLLRLLENGEFYPLGSAVARRSDARIVVATNRDLAAAVAEGRFRADLFYRLRTHRIHIPPLRERREDIPVLVERFLRDAVRDLGRPVPVASPSFLDRLMVMDFPGNARELRSMVFDAASRSGPQDAFMEPDVKAEDGPIPATVSAGFTGRLPTIRENTAALIEEALRRSGGNQAGAAHMLGISQQALSKRLKLKAGKVSHPASQPGLLEPQG